MGVWARLGIVGVVGLTGVVGSARAEDAPGAATGVVVSTMIGCPGVDEIVAWVGSSPTARARLAGAEAPGVTIVLAGASPTIEGVLVLRAGAEVTERRVGGARCDEVARAVALVARLALEALPEPAVVEDRAVPVEAVELAVAGRAIAPARIAVPWAWNAGGLVAVRGGAPELALAGGAFVEVARGRIGVRLGALATTTSRAEVMSVRGELAWTLATADVCAVLARVGTVAVGACGGVEAGVLRARGQGTGDPVSESRPWVATGVDLRARVAALGPVALELAGGVRIPLIRDTFRFDPDVELHATPAVLGQVAANLTVSIW